MFILQPNAETARTDAERGSGSSRRGLDEEWEHRSGLLVVGGGCDAGGRDQARSWFTATVREGVCLARCSELLPISRQRALDARVMLRWHDADRTMRCGPVPSGRTYPEREGLATCCDERGGTTPFNLLPMPTGGGEITDTGDHPTATPYRVADWWCRYLLPSGGVLLDPFVGSGTTLVAGLDNGASRGHWHRPRCEVSEDGKEEDCQGMNCREWKVNRRLRS